MKKKDDTGIKIIAKNKKAFFEYFIEEKVEAGIALIGSEVKSLRENQASLSDAYVIIKGGEAFLLHAHIAQYPPSGMFNHEPKRPRKLLLHKKQIRKLDQALAQKGLTIVPTMLYFKKGRAKAEIALAKGKKKYDKRESIKKRESDRNISRSFRRG
jgi:SsrA-binding protein